jgi:hypothetical protein
MIFGLNPVEFAVALILVVWLVLSALFQINPISPYLGRFDPFALLPKWTFFAPNPGISDYHVVFRATKEKYESAEAQALTVDDELMGPWQDLQLYERDVVIPLLWNPNRRITKTLSDVVNGIVRYRAQDRDYEKHIIYGVEYIWLTHTILTQIEAKCIYQWALLKTHGFVDRRNLAVIYLSNCHYAEENA